MQEYITQIAPRTEIYNRFRQFLRSYRDPETDAKVYVERINKMCQLNLSSFEVNYDNLAKDQSVLAFFLPECPTETLEIFKLVSYLRKIISDENCSVGMG